MPVDRGGAETSIGMDAPGSEGVASAGRAFLVIQNQPCVRRVCAYLHILCGDKELVGGHPVFADLTSIDTTSPAGRKLDMPLLKAVGIKKEVKTEQGSTEAETANGEIDYKKSSGFAEHVKSQKDGAVSKFAKEKSIRQQREYLPVFTVRDTNNVLSSRCTHI